MMRSRLLLRSLHRRRREIQSNHQKGYELKGSVFWDWLDGVKMWTSPSHGFSCPGETEMSAQWPWSTDYVSPHMFSVMTSLLDEEKQNMQIIRALVSIWFLIRNHQEAAQHLAGSRPSLNDWKIQFLQQQQQKGWAWTGTESSFLPTHHGPGEGTSRG